MRAASLSSASAQLRDERRAQQQVFGRVAGERELGERDEVAAGGVGPLVGVEDARRRCRRDRRRRGRAARQRGGAGASASGYATLPAWPAGRDGAARRPTSTPRSSARPTPRTARHARGAGRSRRIPRLADELARAAGRCATGSSRSRARRARCRPRSSPTTRCSIRCATPDDFARERTVDGVPRVVATASEPARRRRAPSVEAARAAADRGARPARRRRPAGRRPRARRARRRCAWRPRSRSSSPTCPFAVIGMGKLGGASSTTRATSTCCSCTTATPTRAERAARALLATMIDAERGRHRVPHRRQPPARRPAGSAQPHPRRATRRTTTSGRSTWEFQALLKARPVAGDRELGERVHGASTTPARVARRARSRRGPRDPGDEGARRGDHRAQGPRRPRAQARARRHPRHRVRGAAAPARARPPRRVGAVAHHARRARTSSPTAATSTATTPTGSTDAYRFLRTVEHRLQLYDEQQTHTHPVRRAGARRAWRACSATATARSATALERVRSRAPRAPGARCAAIHERLFFAPLLETLAGTGPLSPEAAEERLAAFGFTDVERTRAAVRELAVGLTRRSRLMQQLLPVILELALGDARPRPRAAPAAAPGRGPGALARRSRSRSATHPARPSARATSSGRAACVGDALRRHPEFVDTLDDDDALAVEATARRAGRRRARDPRVARRPGATPRGAAPVQAARAAAHRDARPARLRAPRGDRTRAHRRWPRRASRPRWRALRPAGAVRGDRHGPPRRRRALVRVRHRRAVRVRRRQRRRLRRTPSTSPTQLVQEIGATTAEGQTFRIDARLRPEGNQGPLARSLGGYRQYYEQWGLTWERQALTKARFVAGDADARRALLRARRPTSCTDGRSPTTTCARSAA